MNDCKYGHDVEGGRMRLTLLRSPIAPDPQADRGLHYFTYSILPFNGYFGNSGVIRSAYELNSPVAALFGSSAHLQTLSFCSVDGNAVIIECIKTPENGSSNEVIIRLYESLGGKCKTSLYFSQELISAAETDMLEDNPRSLVVQGSKLDLEFRAFEIKTIRVKVAKQ
jgi:alpha-mannosidase